MKEVKELSKQMSIFESTHIGAQRVGAKGNVGKGNFKERALIVCFPTMEAKKEFLKKRPTLEKTKISLGDDHTLAQITHMQEKMPEIREAREEGKIAVYRVGKVVILEKLTT